MNFDEPIERRGTHCAKWDAMEQLYGVSNQDGLSMWVADMDFRSPKPVQDALASMLETGVYGYFGDQSDYLNSIQGWMKQRHDWSIEQDWILSVQGLVNGTALCVDVFSDPGDHVVLFTPVYHAFAKVLKAANRNITECPLIKVDGKYQMDFASYDALMTGREKIVILCSPHNPGGRVWNKTELEELADFARRHDLLIVSDEIHHDLIYAGHKHIPMAHIDGISDRLIMMTAASKTFNIAGAHLGNIIVEDDKLRDAIDARNKALGLSPNLFGYQLTTAAYSPESVDWLVELIAYLEGNRRIFDAGINAIPGIHSMPLESTYLSWVDFTDTGMPPAQILERVEQQAKIAANHGETFGTGGQNHLRFNIAAPRSMVAQAVERIQSAFSDLQ